MLATVTPVTSAELAWLDGTLPLRISAYPSVAELPSEVVTSEHLTPQPADWPFPHPDFLQVVCVGQAMARDNILGDNWTDTEGWELRSTLVDVGEAFRRTDPSLCAGPFLELLRARL